MSNNVDLKKFCLASDSRLAEPMSDDDFTYATDGHIIIRVPRIKNINKWSSLFEDLVFEPKHEGKWIKMPEYKYPPRILCPTCPACHGAGSIAGRKDGLICERCKGEGEIYESFLPSVIIHDTKLNIILLDKIKDLKNIQLFFPEKENIVCFKFNGGDGILMKKKD